MGSRWAELHSSTIIFDLLGLANSSALYCSEVGLEVPFKLMHPKPDSGENTHTTATHTPLSQTHMHHCHTHTPLPHTPLPNRHHCHTHTTLIRNQTSGSFFHLSHLFSMPLSSAETSEGQVRRLRTFFLCFVFVVPVLLLWLRNSERI